MGATYPLMMAFLKEHYQNEKTTFSFLYLANVVGAMTGTIFTVFFMIEVFGFRNTLFISAGINIIISLLAALFGFFYSEGNKIVRYKVCDKKQSEAIDSTKVPIPYVVWAILFITGFSSMGMEVVWIRAFTPVLGTLVYSFAILLFTYLFATWLGSYIYRKHKVKDYTWNVPFLVFLLSVSSFFPIIFTDPRIPFISRIPLISIFPICAVLGYLTPKIIDENSGGDPESAGMMYAVNIAGCVLGPLIAAYILLPLFGSRISIIILSLPFLWLFVRHWRSFSIVTTNRIILTPILLVILLFSVFASISLEEGYKKIKGAVVRHDYTATVVSFRDGETKELLVDGRLQTYLTVSTKDMAHIPLAFLKHEPQSALVICFGMGTTLRSLASWGIDATAVELVPSVAKAFGYYHLDADRILAQPNIRIIVDDGRRFLRRTDKKFDIITIDPPPPVEAAASSLLYSEEFYSLIQSRLMSNGILQQWVPKCRADTLAAITTALIHSFPYVLIYRSIAGEGHHYLASTSPIQIPTVLEAISRMPKAARNDRLEWSSTDTLINIWSNLLKLEVFYDQHQQASDISITDDRPFNEYCFLRLIRTENLEFFLNKIKKYTKNIF
ncbi:MAG: fused MFS/spermidine synthase [Proteobacteria bacterium]|nr:fused MFS/spermidine synthase [Pseudomonadota bacterium]